MARAGSAAEEAWGGDGGRRRLALGHPGVFLIGRPRSCQGLGLWDRDDSASLRIPRPSRSSGRQGARALWEERGSAPALLPRVPSGPGRGLVRGPLDGGKLQRLSHRGCSPSGALRGFSTVAASLLQLGRAQGILQPVELFKKTKFG